MNARPYQSKASDATFEAWKDNRSALVVMPTGTGKTVLFALIIQKMLAANPGKCAMVLVHRQELAWQARDKIQKVTGLNVDVEMGEYKAAMDGSLFHPRAQVIVSTVQTHTAGGDGAGRIGKFDPNDFCVLICDEAHHSISDSWVKCINYYLTNPALYVFGCTATPDRADEEALGQVFDTVAFDYEILDAIKDGWLVPIEQQMVNVESINFENVRTTAGDLNSTDLEAVMTQEKNLHGVASSTIDIIGNKRGLGFASSVEHARILSEIFNRHRGGMSSWVCGKTDKDERKLIVEKFARGDIQWLWNCGVFTEGFDDSGIEVISQARPTKSRALYAQFCGRGTRPHESIAHRLGTIALPFMRRMVIARSVKPSCLIIDFVGNSGKHKLITTADILGGNVSEEAIKSAVEFARKAGRPVRMAQQLLEEEEKAEKARLETEARKARLTAKASFKTQKIDPFDVLDVKPNKPRGWDEGKEFTEKQKQLLRKQGFDPEIIEYARGKQLIGIMLDRWANNKCSIKQASLLKKHGYADAAEYKFDYASKLITAIQQNGWRRPEHFEAPAVEIVPSVPSVVGVDDDIPF